MTSYFVIFDISPPASLSSLGVEAKDVLMNQEHVPGEKHHHRFDIEDIHRKSRAVAAGGDDMSIWEYIKNELATEASLKSASNVVDDEVICWMMNSSSSSSTLRCIMRNT